MPDVIKRKLYGQGARKYRTCNLIIPKWITRLHDIEIGDYVELEDLGNGLFIKYPKNNKSD